MGSYTTTDAAAYDIVRIIEDEAARLDATVKLEKSDKRKISNELIISIKRSGQTFRISFDWIRQECLNSVGYKLGTAYIETEWSLYLQSEDTNSLPAQPPFYWEIRPADIRSRGSSQPRILDETWLRRLIRERLAVPQHS